jgi:ribosome-associated translation inhibitor RaiA
MMDLERPSTPAPAGPPPGRAWEPCAAPGRRARWLRAAAPDEERPAMRYQLHNGEIPVPAALARVIGTKAGKIEKRLKRYHPDVAELEIRLVRVEKINEFECKLVLTAFKETLHARKSAPELRVAVDKSFEAIMRELEHYRVRLNKSLQDHS